MILEQSIKQEQRLLLSQKQTLSLQVLAMNNTELDSYVEEQQLENPILEVQRQHNSYEEMAAIGQWFRSTKTYEQTGAFEDEEEYQREPSCPDAEPLKDFVIGQLSPDTPEALLQLIDFLVDSLDNRGYLPLSIGQIAVLTKTDPALVEAAVSLLQSLDPLGIGAYNLNHCLILQARAKKAAPEVLTMIENYLEDIGEGHYHRISRDLGISVKKIKEYVLFIKSLNPLPINGFSKGDVEYIVPDVIFTCPEGEWQVEINDNWIGSIGVSRMYMNMAKEVDDPEIRKYFSQKIEAANFVVRCVEQRRATLKQVSEFILSHQLDYFNHTGPLRPLTLRQIADALSIHESTASRALKDKYVASPRGTFALKRCLVGGILNSEGEKGASRSQVLDKLKELVQNENPAKPLSDSNLSVLLEEAGMAVSRRTVTKYREELGIPNAFARRY